MKITFWIHRKAVSKQARARICDGLGFLGIELEEKQNMANADVISANAGRVAVRVIHMDEESELEVEQTQ